MIRRRWPTVGVTLDVCQDTSTAVLDKVSNRVHARLSQNAERLNQADKYAGRVLDRFESGKRSAEHVLIKPAIFLLGLLDFCFQLLKKSPSSVHGVMPSEIKTVETKDLPHGLFATYQFLGFRVKELGLELNKRWGWVLVAGLRKVPLFSFFEPKVTEIWNFAHKQLFGKEGEEESTIPKVPDEAIVARRHLKKVKENEINLKEEHEDEEDDDEEESDEEEEDDLDIKKKK